MTFPDPSAASPIFADFVLPGGDELTVAATGLSADRIQVSADGGGLFPDGAPDSFYALNFTAGSSASAPEPTSLILFGAGVITLAGLRQRRKKSI